MHRSKSFMVMCGVTGTFEPLDTILDRLALRGVFPEQNAAVVGLRDHALKGRVERRRARHDHRASRPPVRNGWTPTGKPHKEKPHELQP